jgi:hypothetical protein
MAEEKFSLFNDEFKWQDLQLNEERCSVTSIVRASYDSDSFLLNEFYWTTMATSRCCLFSVQCGKVMIPYFGCHSSKQFIHGKPILYSYKVWALCTSGESRVWFVPYWGRDTQVEDIGMGQQGPKVVLQLLEKASLLPGRELFFDNLFTSFPLLDNLSARSIASTGTVRQNM